MINIVVKLIRYGLDKVKRKRKQQKAENANSLDISVSNIKKIEILNTFKDWDNREDISIILFFTYSLRYIHIAENWNQQKVL